MSIWLKASFIGLIVTVASYATALIFAAAQLHTAVVIFAWPIFMFLRMQPAGEPVTTGSPSNPWPLIVGAIFGWLLYSTVSYFWLWIRSLSVSA